MFINCPHCQALIATDPATDLPPPKCPRCAAGLRGNADAAVDASPSIAAAAPAPPAGGNVATAPSDAFALPEVEPLDAKPAEAPGVAAAQPRADLSTAIAAVISPIATLLKPAPRAPAESPATPASVTEPGAATAAPPAPESTSTAAPATAASARDTVPPEPEGTTTTTSAAAADAPEDGTTAASQASTTAATATTTAPAPAGDAATTSQATREPADASPGKTAEEPGEAPATSAYAPAGAASTGPANGPADAPSAEREDARAARPVDGPTASPAEPEAPATTGEPATAQAATTAGTATADTSTTTPRPATATPSFARTGAVPHHGFDWKTATVVTALALLLALQLLLAGRAQLADDARWRPLVSTLCSVFGCALPPWREPAAFTVLARDVRPHPSLPGVLRVTATLRNDARWSQPWPRLRLTLSDVDGNPVAARDFAASEYLGARSSPQQIASGQVAAFAMDIVEPAPRSVAFDFELH